MINKNIAIQLHEGTNLLENALITLSLHIKNSNLPLMKELKVEERINSYFESITKQREYISELEVAIDNKNLLEMNRLSKIIMYISNMIKEDANVLKLQMISQSPIIHENVDKSTLH